MNKQKRTFTILVIVLVACLAGYMGLLNYNKYKSDDDSETDSESVEALSIDSSDVDTVSFLIDGQEYTFRRAETADTSDSTESSETEDSDADSTETESYDSNQWVCDNDQTLNINASKITTILATATSLDAAQEFDSDVDTSDFGFDEPQNVVKLGTADKTYTITIGARNAMLGQYYLKINDTAYLSDTTLLGLLPNSIDDMVEAEDTDTESTEGTEGIESTEG